MDRSADTNQTVHELVKLIYNNLEMDDIYWFVLSYIEQKYKAELEDVTDVNLKQHIVEQRLSSSFEECGIMDNIMTIFNELGLTDRLKLLEDQKSALQSQVESVQQRIDLLVSEMTSLQIK
ncbi:unnamed protein product [Echinostoma caproni]|uniref:Biogenesis of lysosome-related organelles complex 1 subunit BLS1 n=1 Tax=Echinostoma caproni TaxID=27848 RepID=A0A183BG59_9TREM|nr:unnamed protein product [Echinostoma caproni]